MANTLVQFRVEESIRERAGEICEKVGIDIPTYMRMCLARLVQENGVPFSMKLGKVEDNKGFRAMQEASRVAENYKISDMSLDEINKEIAETRR